MRLLPVLLLGAFWIILASCSIDRPVSLRSPPQDDGWMVTSTLPLEFSPKVRITKDHDRVMRNSPLFKPSASIKTKSQLYIYRLAKGNFTTQTLRKEILSSQVSGVSIERNIRFTVTGSKKVTSKIFLWIINAL